MNHIWGVDSAATVDKELYECVLNQFGKPLFWGRYLVTVPNAANGLTRDEISLLRNSGTKIMPIYSNFTHATGERQGRTVAKNMIYHAKRLGFPKGKILFAYIERNFAVDAAWINGYINTMYTNDYKAGIYFDPIKKFSNKDTVRQFQKIVILETKSFYGAQDLKLGSQGLETPQGLGHQNLPVNPMFGAGNMEETTRSIKSILI